MKKIISLLLCAALIFICLPGCTKQEESAETKKPTQGVENVELTLPADERPYVGMQLRFLSHLSENDPRTGVLKQAAEVFLARTGAEVVFYWTGDDGEGLFSTLSGGMEADIFAASADALESHLQSFALDLTQLAAAADYESHSYKALRDQIIARCGTLSAIPQEPRIYAMYYNADTVTGAGLTELPTSWADFLTFSQILAQNGVMPLAIDYENAHIILELHLERHLGLDRFKALMGQGGWTQTTETINLFRLAIDYAGAGYLAKGDPSAFPAGQNKLALSNVAMVAGSNELCAQVEKSTMMDVNWGVFPYPGDGAGKGFFVESQVLAVHKDSANAQAAFDFIMLLTTGAFDQLYADVCSGIPADPANHCTITGAAKLLETADVRGFGLLHSKDNELFSRLWNGWYKTASYFAGAMNGLAADYAPMPQGVG